MSGLLAELDGQARAFLGLNARIASFRGAPFHVEDTDREGGRRVVVHEFPRRDEIGAEDLGRSPRRFNLTGYLIGADWAAARDRLLAALEDSDRPGTHARPRRTGIAVPRHASKPGRTTPTPWRRATGRAAAAASRSPR